MNLWMFDFMMRGRSLIRFYSIVSVTFGRRDITIVILSYNPKESRKSYIWYVITLTKYDLNLSTVTRNTLFEQIWSQNSNVCWYMTDLNMKHSVAYVHFFCF